MPSGVVRDRPAAPTGKDDVISAGLALRVGVRRAKAVPSSVVKHDTVNRNIQSRIEPLAARPPSGGPHVVPDLLLLLLLTAPGHSPRVVP